MLGFGLGSIIADTGRNAKPLISRRPGGNVPVGSRWTCRYGGLDYEVDTTGFPPDLLEATNLIKAGSSFQDELAAAVDVCLKYRLDFKKLVVVLVDCLCLNNLALVRLAKQGLLDVVDSSDIPVLLKPFKGLNYAAQAECLGLLGHVGDPSVRGFVSEVAVDHQIPRMRRVGAFALSALIYTDRETATEAYQTLTQLSRDDDWALRYACIVSAERFRCIDLVDEEAKAQMESSLAERSDASNEDNDSVNVRAKVHVGNLS